MTAGRAFVAARDQVSCDLEGEAAVLNLTTGIYYGLDTVGARVWQLIQTPATLDSICAVLVEKFDTDLTTLRTDVGELLDEMMKEGLVELAPGEASA